MPDTHREGFRPDIEGIRAIAILLVVAFHAGLAVHGGYIGVDVFFVLSGYLITGLMRKEAESTGKLSFRKFYARRVRRLVPAAALVTVITVAFGLLVYAPSESIDFARSARAVATYLGNVSFARNATDYFRLDAVDPLLHTWSLAVEEQFYLVWPLLFGALTWLGLKRRKPDVAVAAGIGVVSVVSFALCVRWTDTVLPNAFYLSPARFWEFGIGALATFIPASRLANAKVTNALAWSGAALIGICAFTLNDATKFPGAIAAVPAVATAALLLGGTARQTGPLFAVLRSGPMQWIGRHSYAWYLWHWPFIVYARVIWNEPDTWVTVVAAILSLAAAVLTRVLVEDPIRFNKRLTTKPVPSLAMGVSLVLVTLVVAVGVGQVADSAAKSPNQRIFAAAHDEQSFNATPCAVGILGTAPAKDCVFGDTTATDAMVLFGDSHAAQWFPAADATAKQNHWRLIVLTKSSCPTADVPSLTNLVLHRRYTECETWRDESIEKIVGLRPVLVVTGNADISAPLPNQPIFGVTLAQWQAGLRKTAEAFSTAGIRHVALADSPAAGFDVPLCLARAAYAKFGRDNCGFARATSLNPYGQEATESALKGLTNARFVSFNDVICPTATCPTVANEQSIYRDRHHLSAHYVATISTVFDERVTAQN